ncbi:unnamed protein product [Tuber melanosporum]|uniref:(Perigord truffle) hypothetical protein n=1 Tax=Tuber melanosporum (strain Mel28) TaxID=656061 RepID=D5G775_TUBMM|nr:uncharacterized protein GSTUM_00002499001 [Tuber melanosporum]CAZ80368.1 unnamed protein product [Tuber melanosporum]
MLQHHLLPYHLYGPYTPNFTLPDLWEYHPRGPFGINAGKPARVVLGVVIAVDLGRQVFPPGKIHALNEKLFSVRKNPRNNTTGITIHTSSTLAKPLKQFPGFGLVLKLR